MDNEEAMNALKSELAVIKRKIQNNEQEMTARNSRIRELENLQTKEMDKFNELEARYRESL